MGRHFITAAFLILVFCFPAGSQQSLSGRWETWIMGHKLQANISQEGDVIGGVAYVFGPDGKKVTYHFNGHVQNGKLEAVHSDGHSFSGKLINSREIAGTITAASGRHLNLTLTRR
jgi:hypothetical protein